MSLTPAQKNDILALRDTGHSMRAIAELLHVGRRTVKSVLAPPPAEDGTASAEGGKACEGKLDGHRGWLLARMEQYPSLNAHSLFQQLRERGFTGSYSLVRREVASLRPKQAKAYRTLSFAPGEAAQVDWGEWGSVAVKGGRRRVSFFVMVLCHSRMLYAEIVFGESMEFWLQAHRNAFEFFGGIPKRVIVDNCKTAVLRPAGPDRPAELNPVYMDFAARCGFGVTPCAVRHPQSKGMVENAVGYIKTAFLAGREIAEPSVVNPALLEWLRGTANVRRHGGTGTVPRETFDAEERKALRPLPVAFPPCCLVKTAAADSRFRVNVGSNRYSVESGAASRKVRLELYTDRVVIRDDGGKAVADHPRCFGLQQEVVDPDHDRALVMAAPSSSERTMLNRYLALGGTARAFLDGLKEKVPSWRSHVRQLLAMVDIHGRDAVMAKMDDCLEYGAFSAAYIHNMLEYGVRGKAGEGAPLHVTRNADMLELEVRQQDMGIYEMRQEEGK